MTRSDVQAVEQVVSQEARRVEGILDKIEEIISGRTTIQLPPGAFESMTSSIGVPSDTDGNAGSYTDGDVNSYAGSQMGHDLDDDANSDVTVHATSDVDDDASHNQTSNTGNDGASRSKNDANEDADEDTDSDATDRADSVNRDVSSQASDKPDDDAASHTENPEIGVNGASNNSVDNDANSYTNNRNFDGPLADVPACLAANPNAENEALGSCFFQRAKSFQVHLQQYLKDALKDKNTKFRPESLGTLATDGM